jgi:plastocyanin
MKKTISLLMTITTLFLVLANAPQAIPAAYATARTFTLTGARSYGWNTTNPGPTLYVTQGDAVTANLVSGDGFPHTFIIDAAQAGINSSPNCSIDKCSAQFNSGTAKTFSFTADLQPGTYTYFCSIHLAAMRGSIVVQSSGTMPDFSATSNPSTLTVSSGSSGSAIVTVTSLNGFSGTVSLTATISPNGPQVSFSTGTVALSSNGSGSTTLTVSTSTGIYSTPVSSGAYTITITESSGSLSHSTSVPLTVGSSSSSSGSSVAYSSGLPDSALLGGTIAVLAIVAVAIVAVVARRRMKT